MNNDTDLEHLVPTRAQDISHLNHSLDKDIQEVQAFFKLDNVDNVDINALLADLANEMLPAYFELEKLRAVCGTTEQAKLWISHIQSWKKKFIESIEDPGVVKKRLSDLSRVFTISTNVNTDPLPSLGVEDINEHMNAAKEVLEYMYSQDKLDEETYFQGLLWNYILGNGSTGKMLLEAYKRTGDVDPEIRKKFIDAIAKSQISLSPQCLDALIEKLLSAMVRREPQVDILQRGGNIWGMNARDHGIGDFVVHSYATPISPININELLRIAQEVPTTDYAKFEKNRLDALSLKEVFGNLRDFIHDQRPQVHQVINAMVRYYDSNDPSELKALLSTIENYVGSEQETGFILDRNRYDQIVEEEPASGSSFFDDNPKTQVITILRRLNVNTTPTIETPPRTSDEYLNEKLVALSDTRESSPRFEFKRELASVLDYVSGKLATMMTDGEIGIEPHMVLALSWLERRQFEVLQEITYETQPDVYKQPWFQSILRFQELTASPDSFDENEFRSFLEKLNTAESDQLGFSLVGRRTLDHVKKLASRYREMGREDRVGSLWSGNTAHELLLLIMPHEATTAVGKKLRNEDPGHHPGD